MKNRTIKIPHLVRIKPAAIDRVGIYLKRNKVHDIALLFSEGLPDEIIARLRQGIEDAKINIVTLQAIAENSLEVVSPLARKLAANVSCVIGCGGGKALDVAKHVAHLSGRAMYTVPTSLSNDGFASPQASLIRNGKRTSLSSRIPDGVVVDTEVCLQAPEQLWLSGIGDLVAKLTAVRDWKLAFHHDGTPVDDFAALMSDASVFQFIGRPTRNLEGMKLLATALLLNGVAMSVCGSSRPASGSEHLISHALDLYGSRMRLHGLQVGVATYLISQLYEAETEVIRSLFDQTGFWSHIADDPFIRREWRDAIENAPTIKDDFHTVLSVPGMQDKLRRILDTDDVLERCFID